MIFLGIFAMAILFAIVLFVIHQTVDKQITEEVKEPTVQECKLAILEYVRELFLISLNDDVIKYKELNRTQLEAITRTVHLDVYDLSVPLSFSSDLIQIALEGMCSEGVIKIDGVSRLGNTLSLRKYMFRVDTFNSTITSFSRPESLKKAIDELFKNTNGKLSRLTCILARIRDLEETTEILDDYLKNDLIRVVTEDEVSYLVLEKYKKEIKVKEESKDEMSKVQPSVQGS